MSSRNYGDNFLSVTLCYKGVLYTADAPLPHVAIIAEGPQSLESGLMSVVREISQKLYIRSKRGSDE